jgi:D-beta-D-heptose 7-phosphate kinase/D-beta-D-heptose 1-phosphate adenosyltransferase
VSPVIGPLVEAFSRLAVLVVGDAMLDAYFQGTSDRLCPEAPVPVVTVASRTDAPGGAANTAVNVAALGARVTLLSVVGDDAEAGRLACALEARSVSTAAMIRDRSRCTLAKHRLLAGSQMLVRFDHGSTGRLDAVREREVAERLAALFGEHDAVVVSDYAYGVLGPRVIAALAAGQARAPRVIVTDSKQLAAYRGVGVTAVKPNYREALTLLGTSGGRWTGERTELITRHGLRLLEVTGAQIAAVTLDTEGALFFERGRAPYRTYARPADASRAAGAGDTFAAALALALAAGADVSGAAEVASAAAAIVVAKAGTATCSAAELRGYLAGGGKYVADAATLEACMALHRRAGRRIVLTSGCFDILHRGHIAYLNAAKALGDVLVVALNSDASVARLKGPDRPINALEDRAEVLAALSSVDHIVPFDDDTPIAIVRAVRPDVFVKGGDYTRAMLAEAPVVEGLGGEVTLLPYVQERSTTSLIQRIRAATRAA